jgi:hypothetical protein
MRWMLTIALTVAACRGTPRDSDCKQVRDVLDGVPRRYRAAAIADKLASAKLRDDDVQAAVRDGDLAKLESLCEVVPGAHQHLATGTLGDSRLQDCRLVLMWVPTVEGEAKGEGIFDPSVPNAEFRDPEIRAAMKELVESGWAPLGPARATPDPRLAKIRELCSYPTR